VNALVERIVKSDEPSVRLNVRVRVLGEDPDGRSIRALQGKLAANPRVRLLLSERTEDGHGPRQALRPMAQRRGLAYNAGLAALRKNIGTAKGAIPCLQPSWKALAT